MRTHLLKKSAALALPAAGLFGLAAWAQEAAATPLPPASVTGAELEARCRAGLLPAPRPRVLSAAR